MRRPTLESLETRDLMAGSVTASVASGILRVTGDSQANAIWVDQVSTGGYRVTGLGGTKINATENSLLLDGVTAGMKIDLQGGNDLLLVGGNANLVSLAHRFSGASDLISGITTADSLDDLDAPFALTIGTGAGNDRIAVAANVGKSTAKANLSISSGVGDDQVAVLNSQVSGGLIMATSGGNDTVDLSDVNVSDMVYAALGATSGPDSDVLRMDNVAAGRVEALTDFGNDSIVAYNIRARTQLKLQAGSEDDYVKLTNSTAKEALIWSQGGNDEIRLINVAATLQVAVDSGAGSDNVTFEAVTGPTVVNRPAVDGTDQFVQTRTANQGVNAIPRDATWIAQSDAISAKVEATNPDMLFIGDSITWLWDRMGRDAWNQYFVPMNSANLGIFSDRTQNVLWRLENGNLAHSNPRVAVVLIGTNNLNGNPKYTTDGIEAVVEKLRSQLPETKVLLLGLLPRGATADNAYRPQITEINQALSQWQAARADQNVTYLDVSPSFLNPDGTQITGLFADELHPSAQGYQVLAQAILPTINELRNQQAAALAYLLSETPTGTPKRK